MEPNGCWQLNSYLVGIKSPTEKSSIVPLTDSDFLKIQCVEVDRVLSIAGSEYPGFKIRDQGERASLLSQFHKETLQMAQSAYKTLVPEEYCRTLIANVLRLNDAYAKDTSFSFIGTATCKAFCVLIDSLCND